MKDAPPILTELTAQNVQNVVMNCLLKDQELPKIPEEIIQDEQAVLDFLQKAGVNCVPGHGAMLHAFFHKGRLEESAGQIKDMLRQLPEAFDANGEGGGHSFLCACVNRQEELWGQHRDVDALLTLGIAAGLVRYLLPRDMWHVLPGQLPYFCIDYDKF